MTRKLEIGYIGNGKSVNRYHVPFVLTRQDTMHIHKIWTRNHAEDIWDEIPGTIYTEDLNDLLNDPVVDVIVVNTPSAFHYQYAKQVIEAGKHCLVEKPFTQKLSETKELFALAEEKGVILEGYQNRRFDSDYLTVQKVIESGKLGDLLEVESHYDYFRPEVPESVDHYSRDTSFIYNHACHTFDQIIALFGKPDHVHYDVRELLGEDRMNDYFDVDMYYGTLKVSVKSSYFRIKARPKYVLYGKKGMFVKQNDDKQEADLKKFYMPGQPGFGTDTPEEYGVLTYMDDNGVYHEEKVISEQGDYARYYDSLYETIINGKKPLVKREQTEYLIQMLEEAVANLEK